MDTDRGTILTTDEKTRLFELIELINDCNVTQVDRDEQEELENLLYKLRNDGEELP